MKKKNSIQSFIKHICNFFEFQGVESLFTILTLPFEVQYFEGQLHGMSVVPNGYLHSRCCVFI